MARPTGTYHLRIRATRERAKLSQEEAAAKLNMSRSRLQRIEQGSGPIYMEDALAFAVAYGVTLGQLYGLAPIEVG